MTAIVIFTCGGTFDQVDRHSPGVFRAGSASHAIVRDLRATGIRVEELFFKDSADMTDDDRDKIERAVVSANEERIVIVHGTDTCRETALKLKKLNLTKTVILTGSFAPAQDEQSDAVGNLSAAIIAARICRRGVHLCIGGDIFWDAEFEKDFAKNAFVRPINRNAIS